jgi:multiple sugar transport system permease protein
MKKMEASKTKKYAGGWGSFKRKIAPYIFTAPFFILFLIFSTFPIFYSFYISLHEWNGIREMRWVGFLNYKTIFSDWKFWRSIANTIIMMLIGGIPQHIIGMFFAYILNLGLVRFKDFFKGVLFVPYITSPVAITILFGVLYGTRYGFLNYALSWLEKIGIIPYVLPVKLPVEWLKEWRTWTSLSLIAIWKWTGWNAILYLAGLKAIPDNLYEAARIDGATWWQIFFRITLPLLMPVIYFSTSMTLIFGMQSFDEAQVMIGFDGMPGNLYYGLTTAIYIYGLAFRWGQFGVASAMSYILCIIILLLSMLHRALFGERGERVE